MKGRISYARLVVIAGSLSATAAFAGMSGMSGMR